MNKLWALTKVQLKDFMSRYTQQLNIKSKLLSKLMIFVWIIMLVPVYEIVKQLYNTFSMIGMPELTLTYLYVGATMMVFITGIPLVISMFFYSKDLLFIATLPVKEDTIVFSKLASIYVYLLGVTVILFGVAVGFYGLADGIKPLSLLLGLIGIFLTPLMPMIFATIVILPFMTFVGGRKNRNLMVIVGNVILLAVILVLQLAFTKIQMDPASLQQYLSSEDGLIYLIGHKFPPSVWLTKMITGSWKDMLYYVAFNLGFIAVLKVSAQYLYKGALLKYNQQSGAGRVEKRGKLEYKIRSKRFLLIKRHIGIIFHNPTFMLNAVMTMFIPILLFGIYTAMGLMSLDTFKDPALKPYAIYIFAGIISAPSIVGSLSATVISREGKTFWETRVLPISVNDNLITRIASTVIINGVATVLLAAASFWIFPLGAVDIIFALIVSTVGNLCFSTMDLIINIQRPYLNWSTPTAAVKNNLNVMISFIPRLIFGGIIYGMYAILPEVGSRFMILLVTMILLIGFALSYALIFGRYRLKFINMDV